MNDQLFNFNFPIRTGQTHMICENIHCTKIDTNKTTLNSNLCSSCLKNFCLTCFQKQSHPCQNKNPLFNDINHHPLCFRCKVQTSTHLCKKCNQEYFCQDCSQSVHSMKKFYYHPVTPLSSTQTMCNTNILNHKQPNRMALKQNIHRHHKKSPSYVQLELLHSNSKFQLSQVKDQNMNSITNIHEKLEQAQILICLKKQQTKVQEVSLKQKWELVKQSVQTSFRNIQQKIISKHESIKLILVKQIDCSLKQIERMNNLLKQLQVETLNVKYLIEKNKKSKDNNLFKFIEQKFTKVQDQINVLHSTPFADLKPRISKQFTQLFKKVGQQIDLLSAQSCIKLNDEQKITKAFDQTSLNLKDKKKNLLNSTKSKKLDGTTNKKNVNISFSHQNSQHFFNMKSKKRKASVQLYQMGDSAKQSEIANQKAKQLQRIKSFDFLSSTIASLSSINELKTEKKMITKKQSNLQKQSMIDSKIYLSSQNLELNSKRDKIQNTSLMIEQVQSLNFLTTSSELLPSIQNLPMLGLQTTRIKQQSKYQIATSKSNINPKQKTQNCNKTFSGTLVINNLTSPTNKVLPVGFKSPKIKLRYQNQKKQESLNHLSTFDHTAKQKHTIKKNSGIRASMNLKKE